jgi:hypothetical protein
MNEDALRALVRDTIARVSARGPAAEPSERPQLLHLDVHPSSYQYTLPPSDGPCLIEPGVQCNHCGYCQTHGH